MSNPIQLVDGGNAAISAPDFITNFCRVLSGRMEFDNWEEIDISLIRGLGEQWDQLEPPPGIQIEGRENVVALRQLLEESLCVLISENVLKVRTNDTD